MPTRALSHDGKKHVATVPIRLRKLQTVEPPNKHEGQCFAFRLDHEATLDGHLDSHFVAASLKHIKDLAGIFGNDCVFYLTQDTKAKINIGRPAAKGQAPLIMHLDYEMSSVDSPAPPAASKHQFTPW